MNVLVIAPHPDDEAIGCGGTIQLHAGARGDRVSVVFLTSGELGLKQLAAEDAQRIREAEAARAGEILGVQRLCFLRQRDWYMGDQVEQAALALAPIIAQEQPELIYLPHVHEGHPDHAAALPVLRRALRGHGGSAPLALTYEVWTPLETYFHVEDITPVIHGKLAAIRAYASQVELLRYDRAVFGLNVYRGVTAGACRFAEIFQTADLSEAAAGGAA